MKADRRQINYRDYKKYNTVNISQELNYRSNNDDTHENDYNKFQSILCEVLDKHAPLK